MEAVIPELVAEYAYDAAGELSADAWGYMHDDVRGFTAGHTAWDRWGRYHTPQSSRVNTAYPTPGTSPMEYGMALGADPLNVVQPGLRIKGKTRAEASLFHKRPRMQYPSMDHLQNGVSAKKIVLKIGTGKRRHHKYCMRYFSQLSLRMHADADAPTNQISGVQHAWIVSAFGVVPEFVRTTPAAGDTLQEYGLNVFTLNPNQFTTGAGDGAGNSLLPVTPTIAQEIPLNDHINYLNARLCLDMTNMENIPFFGTFYAVKAKRDLKSNEDPLSVWDYTAEQHAGTSSLVTQALDPPAAYKTNAIMTRRIVHTVPTSSTKFNSAWKVIKVQPCDIAVGASCKLNWLFDMERTYSREFMQRKSDDSIYYPKGCIVIFCVGHGTVVWSNDAAQANKYPIFGSTCVTAVITKKSTFGYVPNRNEMPVYFGYSNQPYGIAVDKQNHMASSGATGPTAGAAAA